MSHSAPAAVLALLLALAPACDGGGDAHPPPPEALSFRSLCAGCHGPTGQGDAARYPPLRGHISRILAAEGGRAYLGRVGAFGVEGPIEADGKGWDSLMAGVRAAPHADLARALNYAAATFGGAGGQPPPGFNPFTAQEIQAIREEALAPHEVRKLRPSLPVAPPAQAPASP